MASHREFVEFITEQLREAGDVRARPMFGEYGLYCDGMFFAVICDDQLFVKPTPQGEDAFPRLPKEPPYEGAKDYLLAEPRSRPMRGRRTICWRRTWTTGRD